MALENQFRISTYGNAALIMVCFCWGKMGQSRVTSVADRAQARPEHCKKEYFNITSRRKIGDSSLLAYRLGSDMRDSG